MKLNLFLPLFLLALLTGCNNDDAKSITLNGTWHLEETNVDAEIGGVKFQKEEVNWKFNNGKLIILNTIKEGDEKYYKSGLPSGTYNYTLSTGDAINLLHFENDGDYFYTFSEGKLLLKRFPNNNLADIQTFQR